MLPQTREDGENQDSENRTNHGGGKGDGSHRTLYVDDVPVAEDTQNGLKSANGDLLMGAGKTLASDTFWSGRIDDVRLYHRVVKP